MLSLSEEMFADIGARVVLKFMDAAEEEKEREFYMYTGLYVLTLFGEMLFNEKEGDNTDGSEERSGN